MELNSIEELLEDYRQGKMVILMDDEDRENEGDLIMAAEKVRPEDINFMATHARGLICLTLDEKRCQQLDLPLMVDSNRAQHGTNFTLSIEAAEGVTTGISAHDRALTVQAAVAKDAKACDIVQPGHIFPLMAQPGGVMSRAGHTEAGCDMSRLAGFDPSAVIVEIMNEDGSMARRADLEVFAQKHDLKIGTIADLIHYRMVSEQTVDCVNSRTVGTACGDFELLTYNDRSRDELHFVLKRGEFSADEPALVRVHVMDQVRDLLTISCPGESEHQRWSLHEAMRRVAAEGKGAIVLICREQNSAAIEQGIEQLLSGKKQRTGQDVVYKQIGTGSQILRDLGIRKMRLMSAPFRFSALSGFGLEVVERVDAEDK